MEPQPSVPAPGITADLLALQAENAKLRASLDQFKGEYLAGGLEIDRLRAQVEKEHECAGELQAGLVKQYGEFAAEIDAKEQMRKETADALDAVRKELTEKDRLYHELSDAIQNLLKAPHNSFNDAMWREKIKGLLTPEVKRKCAHCGSESKNVTCSVCIGA